MADSDPLSGAAGISAREAARKANIKKGLVIVHTGHGKGKTTAALGLLLRAWGRNMRVGMIQFIKNDKAQFGEHKAAKKLGVEILSSGDGFTWLSKDLDESVARARHGWELAQQKIASGDYDVVILDEMTYCFSYGWLNFADVREWLIANKPPMLHLVITGRDASDELIEYADLVTEMKLIKHPFRDQSIRAQAGIEY
ncbi:MAG: cob(I)yrinic acid a,c-diamide adenosyltransferase [Chloroflexi bacterium]|nr:cob(I)yrinic acid a,c-diamide adenosyltransferase [Chloroflexota bacterium]